MKKSSCTRLIAILLIVATIITSESVMIFASTVADAFYAAGTGDSWIFNPKNYTATLIF